jgi:hypothetical protein
MLKRWLRHTENLSDEGKTSKIGLIYFQVGNEKGSVYLINCQEGRGEILIFQVGKGEEMSSAESACQQGMLTNGEEVEEIPHPYEDSCGTASRMNEDDEKLNTSTTEEKDQRISLIIGGVEIFLPSSRGEASIFFEEVEEKG